MERTHSHTSIREGLHRAPENLLQLEGKDTILDTPFTLQGERSNGKTSHITVTLSKEDDGGYSVVALERKFSMERIESPVAASPKSPGTMLMLGDTNARSEDDGLLLEAAIGDVHVSRDAAAAAVRALLEAPPGQPIHLEVPCTLTSKGIAGVLLKLMGHESRSHEEDCSVVFHEETPEETP